MTSGLRKIHKYSWLIIVVIVPLIMILALKDIPFNEENASDTIDQSSKNKSLKHVENNLLKVSLQSNSIEVILKSTLKNASAILYTSDLKGNKNQIIGQLSTVGIYKFDIKTLPKSVILYDELKEELITKLDF